MNQKAIHKLAYRVSGRGCPVVFLHGFLESNKMWEVLNLEHELQMIQIELPGHGKSLLDPVIPLTMESIAGAVIALLDKLEISAYDVVGHSMGGYVALELKRNDPRCEKVVLLNSNFWQDTPAKQKDRRRVADLVQTKKTYFIYEAIPNLFENPKVNDKEVKELIRDADQMTSEAIAAASIAMSKRTNNRVLLEKDENQFAIFQGVNDTIVSKEMMQSELKGLHPVYVELSSGHMAHIECKDQLCNALIDFLRKKKRKRLVSVVIKNPDKLAGRK
ncbi:MAG: alpha/beta hydrolase [Crocinitomicaceae bacterium]|nr:alpha/beta hydrolase [Crocinitomicaceae bacterium]